ncbi:SpoIIE family protein phosphatase [Bdellovibrionota bacterium FG-2]
MDQQQFKISRPIGTKLLVSVVLLLTGVIVFLNVSTILLIKEDKRAYIYQAQSSQAALAGREFVNRMRHALDTVRLSLTTVDPRKPVTKENQTALRSLVSNQSDIAGLRIVYIDKKTGKTTPFTDALKETSKGETLSFDLEPEWLQTVLPKIMTQGFAFLNLSKTGANIGLGVLVADMNLKDNAAGMPLAIGFVPLADFANELGRLNLTITTDTGWVLYDSDPAVTFARKNILDDPLLQSSLGSRVTAGALEYDFANTHYLGSYVQPGLDLLVLTRTEWQKAMRATYTMTEKFILLGLMAIGAAILFAIFFSKSLTAPIYRLYEATKEVAKGNFNLSLKSKSKDEIGALTHSFNSMSKEINNLIHEREEKVRLENEMAIASTVQQTLIPPSYFRNDNILIHSHYQPAAECSGDWWGFFGVDDKLVLMIADVTGHGLSSALITASARGCVSMMHKLAQEDPDFSYSPSSMLSFANRVIYDASLSKIMMTFFIGVLDFKQKTLNYSSAGHNPPWLFKKEGGAFALKSMTSMGNRLGENKEAIDFEEKTVPIAEGDIFFLYTDGILEGKNLEGDQFGKKRTRKLVEASLPLGPEKVIESLMKDFMEYNTGKPLDDDVTLVAATLFPGKEWTA